MQSFSVSDIVETDQYKVIRSNRQKTDENFICLLLPEAEEIAKKCNYNLPKINNQNYNFYLKSLATGAGIKKALTSHTARHEYNSYPL